MGEACLEPGAADDGCPAGILGTEHGDCLPAGIAADGCSPGFVHDGDRGCEPILPTDVCPKGLTAVPGDNDCRPVMPCGEGRWGDVPREASTLVPVANFGAVVSLRETSIECAAFALDGEHHVEEPFVFEDRGDNRCGCPTEQDACVAATAHLAAPEAATID